MSHTPTPIHHPIETKIEHCLQKINDVQDYLHTLLNEHALMLHPKALEYQNNLRDWLVTVQFFSKALFLIQSQDPQSQQRAEQKVLEIENTCALIEYLAQSKQSEFKGNPHTAQFDEIEPRRFVQ